MIQYNIVKISLENFSVMTSFKSTSWKNQVTYKIFYSFLLKSLCHSREALRFQRTSCDLLEGEIMASHFEKEMDATFQISGDNFPRT